MKSSLTTSLMLTPGHLCGSSKLEAGRERLIKTAFYLVPEEVRRLLEEVEQYAPPPERADEMVIVTVEGSNYAYPERDPNRD